MMPLLERMFIFHSGASTDERSNLYVDGFWSSGLGNEGAIRINEEEGA